MKISKRNLLRGAVTAVLATLPEAALCDVPEADLQISPTTLLLAPGGVAIANLYNSGAGAGTAQVRIKRWTQDDAGDVLADTDDVVASPPFATLAPKSSQLLRIADLSSPASADETSYRLLVNQLPSAGALSGSQVEILLAFSVPVFIAGSMQTPPDLSYSIVPRGQDMMLAIYNNGGSHARLTNLQLRAPSGAVLMAISGLAGYALPKSTIMIKIPAAQTVAVVNAELFLQTQFNRQRQQISRRGG